MSPRAPLRPLPLQSEQSLMTAILPQEHQQEVFDRLTQTSFEQYIRRGDVRNPCAMLAICRRSSCHVSVAMVTVARSCVPAGVCRQCMLSSILSEVLANILCGSFCHTTCLKCSVVHLMSGVQLCYSVPTLPLLPCRTSSSEPSESWVGRTQQLSLPCVRWCGR